MFSTFTHRWPGSVYPTLQPPSHFRFQQHFFFVFVDVWCVLAGVLRTLHLLPQRGPDWSNSGLVIQFNPLTLSHRAWCHLFFLGRRKASPMLKCCWTIIWITWRCVVPDVPWNQLFDFVSSKKKMKCRKWFCSLWTTPGSCIRWNGGNICRDQTFRQYQSVTWTERFDGWSWNLRRLTSFIWSGFTSMSSWGSLEEQRQVLGRQEKNTWCWIMA